MARRDREGLLRALEDPGYTPGRRDVTGLLELLPDAPEAMVPRIERALLEQPRGAPRARPSALPSATGDRARLVHALGRLCVAEAAPWGALHALLDHADPAVVKAAVGALAQSTAPDTEAALLALWDRLGDRAPLRAVVRALGRVGGERLRRAPRRAGRRRPSGWRRALPRAPDARPAVAPRGRERDRRRRPRAAPAGGERRVPEQPRAHLRDGVHRRVHPQGARARPCAGDAPRPAR